MNKEEILNKYIDLIDKGYCSDCNELNCIDNFPHAKITQAIRELQQKNQELQQENEKLHHYKTLYQSLKKQNDELKEDILFCLKSIKQEMEMSTDSRTRGEMKSCYEILERWNK